MSVIVVDASIAAKWFSDEEYAEEALSLLDGKNSLHVPDFFLLEMDSIIGKWMRRKVISADEGREVRAALRRFPVQYHPFSACLDAAFEIAHQTGASIYDSLYVALAALLNGKMVTADRKLYDNLKNSQFKKHIAWIEKVGR